jgi:hypothetical protein
MEWPQKVSSHKHVHVRKPVAKTLEAKGHEFSSPLALVATSIGGWELDQTPLRESKMSRNVDRT